MKQVMMAGRRRPWRHTIFAAALVWMAVDTMQAFTLPAPSRQMKSSNIPASAHVVRASALSSTPGGGIGEPSLKQKEADDKRRQYELALGKAADTLRRDYPKMLGSSPNFDIFDPEIELVDPSGVKLHGIRNYKRTFGVLRAVIAFFYNEHDSEVDSRMMFDYATKAIRITWHAKLSPKAIYGGPSRTVHLDGISVYELSRETGRIYQHRLERACINNQPIRYPQGIWSALNTEIVERHGIPVGGSYCTDTTATPPAQTVSSFGESATTKSLDGRLWRHGDLFQKSQTLYSDKRRVMLFSNSRSPRRRLTSLKMTSSSSYAEESMESEEDAALTRALQNQNRSRSKFGLKPMSMEEFKLQRQEVQVMESRQQERLVHEKQKRASLMAAAASAKQQPSKKSPLDAFLSAVGVPARCESNDDCERPMLCCDFIFKQVCCASGTPVGRTMDQLAYVRVPVRNDVDFPENF